MDLFDRVIVGVDGTEWGLEALRQALILAPEHGATLDAVTALDAAPAVWTGFDAANWVELLEQEAQEARTEAAAMLGSRGSARVVPGKSVPVLRAARDELDATLLSLGGRRSSRFLGVMLGDTVTELLHDDRCSVLVARPPSKDEWSPRRVVVGVDGSPSALVGLRWADGLATRLGATVEAVAAGGAASAAGDAEWTERVDRDEAADPVSVLIALSHEADLLVLGSRGLHGLRSIGSVSERVAHQAVCSVLVVQSSAEV